MRFHTIDLRLIGEWSKTNHFSIEQKDFIGLKLYYDLLDEIFNNIGKSLSDLLLKHMDLMNTIYNEDHNKSYVTDSKYVHNVLNTILTQLLNFDLFSDNYSMEFSDNIYHYINKSIKNESNFDITEELKSYFRTKLYTDLSINDYSVLNDSVLNNLNFNVKDFIEKETNIELDNLCKYINEFEKYEKMTDDDITKYINYQEKITNNKDKIYNLLKKHKIKKSEYGFNIIDLVNYETFDNDENILKNNEVINIFPYLFKGYEHLYKQFFDNYKNINKKKSTKEKEEEINKIYSKFNIVLKSLYIFKVHVKRALYKEIYYYLEGYKNIKNIINKQFGKTLLSRKDFIDNFDNIWGQLPVFNNLTDLDTKATLMDIYTLCRMFAKFDENKLERGPKSCRGRDGLYNNPRNIIFYGGCVHTDNYAKFIKSINKNKQNPNNFTINSCMELKESYVDFTTVRKDGFNFFRNTKEYEKILDYHNSIKNNSSNSTQQNKSVQQRNSTQQINKSQQPNITSQNNSVQQPNRTSQNNSVQQRNRTSQNNSVQQPNRTSQNNSVQQRNRTSQNNSVQQRNRTSQNNSVQQRNSTQQINKSQQPNSVQQRNRTSQNNSVQQRNRTSQYNSVQQRNRGQ